MKSSFFRKFFLAFLVMIAVLGTSQAQESSLQWKISGNGLEKESYLFGTIHLICQDQFLMDDRILDAFDQSEKLVMEINMSDPEVMSKMQQVSLNPGMKNIQSELDPADSELIDEFLIKNYGVGLAQLGILKPFILSTMILMKLIPCEETQSYESYFSAKATESVKSLVGLETVEFQMSLFDEIPLDLQIRELIKTMKEEKPNSEFAQLTQSYLSEDVGQLFELMNNDGTMLEYRDILLDSRNKAWIPILEKEMKTQGLFVAVGSGHLGGENGVISLLRKAGYQVEPIRNQFSN